MSADRTPGRGVDLIAVVAGLIFLAFSIFSLTVGVLDLPHLGAAPLWLLLIGAGVLLLFSEIRGRKHSEPASTTPSPDQDAWEKDTYR